VRCALDSGWVVKCPAKSNGSTTSRPASTARSANCRSGIIPAGARRNGHSVCDNKWVDASRLVADGGWPEIQAKLDELCPDGVEKYREWNKAGAPVASHFFPPIAEKEAA
jgi:hypothetical protein